MKLESEVLGTEKEKIAETFLLSGGLPPSRKITDNEIKFLFNI